MKTRHRQYTLPAGYGGSPAVVSYQLRVPGGAHSSAFFCQTNLRRIDEWGSLAVVEGREREIEILLNAPYLRLRPAPDAGEFTWPKLDHEGPRAKLRDMLKKALYLCDVIRDMWARAVCESRLPGGPFSPSHIAVRTRRLQVAFLEGLGDDDLIAVYTLCRIAVESWHGMSMKPAHIFGNPLSSVFEKELVYKETLLRYGSWFLFGEVRGYGARSHHRRQLLDDTHKEHTESPHHLRPILKESALVATMNHALHKRLGVPVRDLDGKVLPRVEKMIGARSPVFRDPPSRHGHGSAAI